ncbi:hypothetical protein PSR1_03518 [Anaeromyxobacter sp. PSR-1]|nr:hypothetical protein PSR1_03518 [Anaeromyxobacter sp. PSR-1]
MSGTFITLTPFGYEVESPAGVIHWCGVPSLIHGVMPPWRCSVARFSAKQPIGFGVMPHIGLRGSGSAMPPMSGPMPAPITVVSTGRNRSPPWPVGSRFRNRMRTGRSLVARMAGPRECGPSTPTACWPPGSAMGRPSVPTSGTPAPGTTAVASCTYPRSSVGGRSEWSCSRYWTTAIS